MKTCKQSGAVVSGRREDLAFGWLDGELVLRLGPDFPIFPLRVELGQLQIGEDGELKNFGAMQVTPGVWWLTPSLNAEGVIHAFLVLYGVQDPAPWERRILLP